MLTLNALMGLPIMSVVSTNEGLSGAIYHVYCYGYSISHSMEQYRR